jgi:hypothetical protein
LNRRNLQNAALFQMAWIGCVLGGAHDTSVWGAAAVLALMGLALMGPARRRDLGFATGAAAAGFLLDTLWIRTGILDYAGAAIAPLWIVLLWSGVGFTINHSLGFFRSRPWLGGAMAAVSAPLSYLAGERLGAVLIQDWSLLPLISLSWMLLFAAAFSLPPPTTPWKLSPRSHDERTDRSGGIRPRA